MTASVALVDAFLAIRPTFEGDRVELEAKLRSRVEAGSAAWPDVSLAPSAFARHLARHTKGDALPPSARAADLYLACACAESEPNALRALDRILVGEVSRAVRRADASNVDDALQTVRRDLLVGPEPRIGEYAGRAALRSWLTTVALRSAMKLRRGAVVRASDPLTGSLPGATRDPELEHLRARYRAPFEQALRAALVALNDKDRTLLRMHLVDRLGIDALARLHRVGRSTAARWLAAARDRLYDGTRAALQAQLHVTPSEFESIVGLVRSDLDVSVTRLLVDARP